MNRQEYYMMVAMEECAEVAQRISKAARFGMDQVQQDPGDRPEQNPLKLNNRARIMQEYADLVAVMELLGFCTDNMALEHLIAKQRKVDKYIDLSKHLGTLQE